MSKHLRSIPGFVFILLTYFCHGQNYCLSDRFSETAFFDSSEIHVDSNITFSSPMHVFSQTPVNLNMDVYYPDMSTDSLALRPFILLIHGGAFLAGSRKELSYDCMEYARRGFVAATIDYRLGWNCQATDILSICLFCQAYNPDLQTATYCAAQDARAALRYIHANASSYHIDPDYLFTGGESAGAITALHATFWDQTEANTFDPSAISRAGLLDTAGNSFTDTYQIRAVINSCGAVSKDSILLNNGIIPVINFHDEFDCVVPAQYGQVISCVCQPFYWAAGSGAIYSRLNANGVCSQYHQVPLSTNHCSFPKNQLIAKASCFLKTLLCQNCQSSFSNQPGQPVSCSTLSGIPDVHQQVADDFFILNEISTNHYQLKRNQYTGPVEFRLTDLSGKRMSTLSLKAEQDETEFSVESFASGIYFLFGESKNRQQRIKIIKP
ncbi:MAG TPA: carboxylesterase family protein [Bacteroidia bacterium]|nr:carboxylesterase family protein [Bacteroidia bacterium]